MKNADPLVAAWLQEVLENDGRLALQTLLERAVPLAALRDLARRQNAAPKGYRIDRAPARRLVQSLSDLQRPEVVEAACELLLTHVGRKKGEGRSKAEAETEDLATIERKLKIRDGELESSRKQTQRAREQAARHRERENQLQRRLDDEAERIARLRAEADSLRRMLESAQVTDNAAPSPDDRRVHELERELDALLEADDGLRRLLALRQARIRELQETVTELEGLVPKGKRRKQPKPEAPALSETFRLPHFLPSFYKSLEGKERRSVEKAFQAVLLFCTEGPSYPGLETKPLEGQDHWSFRASLKLRIYFQWRSDGDVDLIMLADREDQHTALRRLKDR